MSICVASGMGSAIDRPIKAPLERAVAMYHHLEFVTPLAADLEVSRNARLERVSLRTGERIFAELKPYVVETPGGPIEVADLFLEDGTTVRRVPFAQFRFSDDDE